MPLESQPYIAVVVLNWNGRRLLEEYMPSWVAYTPQPKAELIIVDNGSTDDSLEYLAQQYPSLRVIAFPENYGFAEGYNRAIAALSHPIVVLLNSDARLSAGWLDQALDFLEQDPNVAAVQPKILADRQPSYFEYAGASGGYIDRWGYPLCRGRLLDTVEEDCGQYDDVAPIHWASGACLIVRRNAYIEVGGLDAAFFAHQEEIDLCWRIRNRGGGIWVAPQGKVYHLGGASLSMNHPRKSYLNFRNNLLMLYKHLPARELWMTLLVRCLLDGLASIAFLLQDKPQHCVAVWRAWASFLSLRREFRKKRQVEQRVISASKPKNTKFGVSLLWQYYVRKRHHFSELEL